MNVSVTGTGYGKSRVEVNTLPTFVALLDGRPRLIPASVPTLNIAHTPKNTRPALLRLARELRLLSTETCGSTRKSDSRWRDLPRDKESTSSAAAPGDVIRNVAGPSLGNVGLLPTLPPRPYRSVLQDTRFLPEIWAPSEWKLSARAAIMFSSPSSSPAVSLEIRLAEPRRSTLLCWRLGWD